jgi:integrase
MGLEWSDLNFEERSLTLQRTSQYTVEEGTFEDDTKTEKSKRTVYLPPFMLQVLTEYQAWWEKQKDDAKDKWIKTDRLFIQWNGGEMHPDTISSWFPKFLRKNNLPETPLHGLRHFHMSTLLYLGMDYESVADQGGYATTQMLVNVYGHNVRKNNKEGAKLLEKVLVKASKKRPGGADPKNKKSSSNKNNREMN